METLLTFLVILIIVLVVYYNTPQKEGFDNAKTKEKTVGSVKVIPSPIAAPPALNEGSVTSVTGSSLPGQLPRAGYNQIAKMVSPTPYIDPANMKTNRTRILRALEDVKGFLAFEAEELNDRSDPTIQLPLNTLRGDFQRLQSEAAVLQRNPGIQPEMTEEYIAEVEANLAFLQEKVRRMGLAGLHRAFNPFDSINQPQEGFADMVAMDEPSPYDPVAEDPSNGSKADMTISDRASIGDLTQFSARIQAEIMRLSASGTNDPILHARVANLNKMKQDIDQVITEVKTERITPDEIPIMKSDIEKALPTLSNMNEPLYSVIRQNNLPSWLANLIPSNAQRDPSIAKKAQEVLQNLIDGTSLSFAVKYTPKRDEEIARARAEEKEGTVASTGFPNSYELKQAAGSTAFQPLDAGKEVTDVFAHDPRIERRTPGHFNWKVRAKAIEEQIRKRGLKTQDFGVMPEGTDVGSEFSWRGYAKMICSRLMTTSDPALPETCGCPPANWSGWNADMSDPEMYSPRLW
jgi:hypothetical protein